MAALCGLLIALSQDIIARVLNAPDLRDYLWLVAPAVLFQGILLALHYWNSRGKHFRRLSVAQVGHSLGNLGFQIVAGLGGHATGGGLIGGYLFGSALYVTLLGGQTGRGGRRLLLRSVRIDRMLQVLRRYKKFPLVDMWGMLLNRISWQLPAWMLSFFFAQAVVGYYALAYRLIQLPMALVGTAIAQIFFQRASELASRGENLSDTVEGVFRTLVALGMFPALVLAVVGRDAFAIVFGSEWAEAGTYVQILSVWMFVWFVSSPLSTLFSVLERQELVLIAHAAIFVTRLVSLAIGGALDSVYLALTLFAGTGVIVHGGLVVWSVRQADVSFRRVGAIVSHYGVYALPALAVLITLKLWFDTSAWPVLFASVLMAIVYYVLVLRREPALLSALGIRER
jgi:O-antigen/teichoic acid export membrane protein